MKYIYLLVNFIKHIYKCKHNHEYDYIRRLKYRLLIFNHLKCYFECDE